MMVRFRKVINSSSTPTPLTKKSSEIKGVTIIDYILSKNASMTVLDH